MPRRYWYVILTYVIGLFSGILGGPLLLLLGVPRQNITAIWSIIAFSIMTIVILSILKPDMKRNKERSSKLGVGKIILWTVIGFFLVLFVQYAAALIEMNLGIEPGSNNTSALMEVARATPLFLIVTAIFAPVLEEIVFRKVIFGSIFKKYNFLIAAIISAIAFGILHQEPDHLLIYTSVGMVFAYLYVKTKTILVPILTHVSINTFVFIIQYNVSPEDLERMREQIEQLQTILGG
ncbi:hypothetical protein HNQ94_003355 [Salirhabdus euzebyi]|uniref:CAAX prenyl protease 2/Lysostaphin resistance protein A-like domain-containing protein n=1 Tax=Salirhabdus euzebyi TaxID=394506 RepID=A0A841Q8Z7_9BACI|nr:CPBP family intramembrane glutamic endopeptidase [Salirhabdus euzebyi]MBB6454866.1 hypothetical protein [Salirhabdus euzebyi]